MDKEYLKLQRNQIAAYKKYHTDIASFSPQLWKLGAGLGGAGGFLKGSTEQNPDGSFVDAGQRVTNTGLNTVGGAVLGGALLGGVPQLMKENPTARLQAEKVYNATGVNLDPSQVPVGTYDRLKAAEQTAISEGRTIPQKIKRAADPVTGRLRYYGEKMQQAVAPVAPVMEKMAEVAGQGVKKVGETLVPPLSPEAETRKRLLKESLDEAAALRAAELIDEKTIKKLEEPGTYIQEDLERRARRLAEDADPSIYGENPLARAKKTIGRGIEDARVSTGRRVEGAKKFIEEGIQRDAATRAAVGQQIENVVNSQPVQDIVNSPVVQKGTQKVVSGLQAARKFLRLSGGVPSIANFGTIDDRYNQMVRYIDKNPYTSGAIGGSIGGTLLGGSMGMLAGSEANAKQRANEMDYIQSIEDPYMRKRTWDDYNSPNSQLSRGASSVISNGGSLALGAGVGAGVGALAGGGIMTAAQGIAKKGLLKRGK